MRMGLGMGMEMGFDRNFVIAVPLRKFWDLD